MESSKIHSLYNDIMFINSNLSQSKMDKIRSLLMNSSKLLNKTEIVNTWDDRNGKCKFWIITSLDVHFAEVSMAELEESEWFDLCSRFLFNTDHELSKHSSTYLKCVCHGFYS